MFHSFHYELDSWRVAQVRNIGAIEGQPILSDNEWETIAGGGDEAVRSWINLQMAHRSCVVVLVGRQTAHRRWVRYEFEKGWNEGRGVVGIHVHNLLDHYGKQAQRGANPFCSTILANGRTLSSVVRCYDPPFTLSSAVYHHIADNLADWVDEAIRIRTAD